MKKPSRSFAVRVAYDWHGGQFSALYSFASTGGVVHDQRHLERLRVEVHHNIKWCEEHNTKRALELKEYRGPDDYGREPHRLARLLEFIEAASIGSYERYTKEGYGARRNKELGVWEYFNVLTGQKLGSTIRFEP